MQAQSLLDLLKAPPNTNANGRNATPQAAAASPSNSEIDRLFADLSALSASPAPPPSSVYAAPSVPPPPQSQSQHLLNLLSMASSSASPPPPSSTQGNQLLEKLFGNASNTER
jgi:hypothetical protein